MGERHVLAAVCVNGLGAIEAQPQLPSTTYQCQRGAQGGGDGQQSTQDIQRGFGLPNKKDQLH